MDDATAERARRAKEGTPYLNTDEAAHFLKTSRRYLQKLRALGKGPVWRTHSRTIHYHIDDLVAWSEQRSKGRTS